MLQKSFAHGSASHAPKEHHLKHAVKSNTEEVKHVGDGAHDKKAEEKNVDENEGGKTTKHNGKNAIESDIAVSSSDAQFVATLKEASGKKSTSANIKTNGGTTVKGLKRATANKSKSGQKTATKGKSHLHVPPSAAKDESKKTLEHVKMAQTDSHTSGIPKPVRR